MLKFQARMHVGVYVVVDVLATCLAWMLAYLLRFHSPLADGLLPVTKGIPDFTHYLALLPFVAVLWPVIMYFHGLYQLKRGRSRIDEFFAIVFSVLVGTALTLGGTLYVRVYHRYQPDVAPSWEYSQGVFALFALLAIALSNLARTGLRAYFERLWAAGYNMRRVLVAGAGELGQLVANTIATHRELGYSVVGFLDDDPGRLPPGTTGPPILGALSDCRRVAEEQRVDELYIALPLEDHTSLVRLVRNVGHECLDIKVVPDLIQYATMRAALDDLDGIPIISLNEVPLRGWNGLLKRGLDIVLGSAILGLLTLVVPLLPLIALLIKWRGGPGPVLFRQERMSLDGKTFLMYKFRSMHDNAERATGPVFATADDPRRTGVGAFLRRHNLDELPQLLNVVLGDMSLVGPRPERPPFVRQFKERIPQYMLRHRVKSGMTGWAQVNGWRGNTSIEKRIEYDLYYIENWSLLLDLKILILTLFRGFGQKHAY
jgi:Undecaprenyl-phosphate glucose phosphotransferase